MLQKILQIENVGRFESYSAKGDLSMKRLALFFGENGRGKTTISAIARSLQRNEPALITERATLGSTGKPHVVIRMNEQSITFKDSAWNTTAPALIEIFDSTFVDENIFSGESVDHEHKRNLYRFIIGEGDVRLAREIDELDTVIRQKGVEVTAKELAVQKMVQGNISVPEFVALGNIAGVDQLILVKETTLEAARKSSVIQQKVPLQKMTLPEFDSGKYIQLLSKTIADIAADAETVTRSQVLKSMDSHGEEWIERGLGYLKNDDCPFCGQQCADIDLVLAYKGYFNAEYARLKSDIKLTLQELEARLSEQAFLHVHRTLTGNLNLLEFWSLYTEPVTLPDIESDVEDSWRRLRQQMSDHLLRKVAAPLEMIAIDTALTQAVQEYERITEKVKEYNKVVEQINSSIAQVKLSAGSANVAMLERDLARLLNSRRRHEVAVVQACGEYTNLLEEKRSFEKQKKEAKSRLESQVTTVFEKYQASINQYLAKFGAGFKIAQAKTSFAGGRPSSSYCIEINDTSVELGDTKTYGEPCFRNVLSQGDKNTLAFAFFMARLDQDKNISNKIVLFDDPISSLDNTRRHCTRQEIVRINGICKQVIIMSHDPIFLRALWDAGEPSARSAACVARTSGVGSEIQEWDIITFTRGEYFDDFANVVDFCQGGRANDLKAIARSLRPILETYLRTKFPREFLPEMWLGNFIDIVSKDESLLDKQKVAELSELNNYSQRYHHKYNPSAGTEQVSDSELLAYSERTLKFIAS